MSVYRLRHFAVPPAAADAWNSPAWQAVPEMAIAEFRPESSSHHPDVRAKLAWSDSGVSVKFRVVDRYVRAVAEKLNDCVCKDSCVEFFVEPAGGKGYLNFECSCNGTILCYTIRDHRRNPNGFADFTPLTEKDVAGVAIHTTLPGKTDPEIVDDVTWELGLFVPFALLTELTGAPAPVSGARWRANLYKCADATSHPHWASWQPVDELNFHLPHTFGVLEFE